MATNKGLKIESHINENLPVIFVDDARIIQVLTNLINNAIKFTDEGMITIAVSYNKNKGYFTFCVKDSGIGIEEKDLPKLFEKFQQVGEASNQVEGTGLGLSICKEIVREHGGRIWAESVFGKGTSFYFTIPALRKKHVLIVDDDPTTVELIQSALIKTRRYEISVAYDGFSAGHTYTDFKPDIIILDINMPKMNGLEVCSMIKEKYNDQKIVIVMISSFDNEETIKKAFEAGADQIFKKPILPDELLAFMLQLEKNQDQGEQIK